MELITLSPSQNSDVETIANLRAIVLRDDLTRLGRFDEEKVRQRFRNTFVPVHTWIMHFYIHPDYQGRGFGSQVLKRLLEQHDVKEKRVTLNVLQGSSARRLYERFGFTVDSEDPIDIYMSMSVEEPS